MSLRVLHVFDHSIPLHSGYTFRSLSLLTAQRAMGWETFHITGPKHEQGLTAKGDFSGEENIGGWQFFRTPMELKHSLPGLGELRLMKALERRLEAVARQVRPHMLHAHSPVLNALPTLRVGKRLGIPVVYEVRAFWEDAAVDHGSTTEGSLRYRLTRAMETHALKRVDHVFTICEGLRRDIVARGVAAERVTVIPNAVDIDSFELGGTPDASLKAQLGLTDCTVLGFIGSFYAYEGLDLLLEALRIILAQRPEVRVLLVGGGPQDDALRAQTQRLGLVDKVVFTGRVPHAQVNKYYDLIDALVYPRHSMRLTELVTPLKPLEAMAQGRVLLASDVGGHRELIHDGETGLLFKAGSCDALSDAVLRLLAEPTIVERLRSNGRQFVEVHRSWRTSVANYIKPYTRLCDTANG